MGWVHHTVWHELQGRVFVHGAWARLVDVRGGTGGALGVQHCTQGAHQYWLVGENELIRGCARMLAVLGGMAAWWGMQGEAGAACNGVGGQLCPSVH
jgi:hypothetical protein